MSLTATFLPTRLTALDLLEDLESLVELVRGIHNLKDRHRRTKDGVEGTVLTIGAFDGLHRGHRAVLEHLRLRAEQAALPSVVVTLEPLPREYFSPLDAPPRLMSFREKCEGLAELGINTVLMVRFNDKMRNMEATEFIEHVFVEGLSARHIVVGDDLRFGRDGGGDFDLLEGLALKHNFTVEDTSTLALEGQRVSSTRIRQLLEAGDFDEAELLLGRPYSISGKVVYGQQLGRTLGTPTANVELHRLRTAMSGVYAVEVQIQSAGNIKSAEAPWLPGVANVGCRPTVNDSIKAILEVHLLDFSGDLYGKRISVRFRNKIREEQKFASLDLLKEQIHRDVDTARTFFTDK